MAYDSTSLKELMEAVRREREAAAAKEADTMEEKTEDKHMDLDDVIQTTLRDLEPFHLTDQERQIFREFLTFQIQTRDAKQPEVNRAYYNLLIHCEEKETIRRVTNILCAALNIREEDAILSTEKDMITRVENHLGRKRSLAVLFPEGTGLILIDECMEKPRLDVDGGGAARDASKKVIQQYDAMWSTVLSYIHQNPHVILIVASDDDVYRSTLRPFRRLSDRICSHHILLTPRTEEELLADCMTELRKSSFSLSDDFEHQLRQYFQNAYFASDLRGQAFISNVLEQIYSRYYCHRRDSLTLTADCIPECDLIVQSAESILGRLDNLVGLQSVKEEFRNIYKMQVAGLTDPVNVRYHMLFAGNPGTGKTTVARMAADLFFRMGIIKTNKLVVAKPSDLVSEWVGGTGTKAMEVIRRAYNGVLFIDEAYGIATMNKGHEVLNLLIQEMENNSDKLIVILAGYTEEMRDLLKSNPGLASRIGQELYFEDYTQEELARIFLQMIKKEGFSLDPSARDELEECINALMTREFFGNARDIRNMLQDLKEIWSDDYYKAVTQHGVNPQDVEKIFLPQHFEKIMPPKKEVSINDMIGLDVLKKKLALFKRQAIYQKHLMEKGFTDLSDFSMHMIFTGNPGTGKTTVAKLIADDLYSIGMLKTNRLVVVERKDLVSAFGETGQKTADVIRRAVGGVLFVDEAYSLAGNRSSDHECIEVMLTAMEAHKSDTVFIFAGYVDEMQEFLATNPGIQSRIGYTFHFEDYSPDELTRMYADKMKKTGFVVSSGALGRVREIMEYFQDMKNFGNGRFVNHVIQQTITQRANRSFKKHYRNIQAQDIPSIKTLIETAPNNMHLYDPGIITPEEQRRTAMHELGHAVVMVGTDPKNVPESISIRGHAGSFGRVKLVASHANQTEQQLLNHIATLLAGKNAEKLFFGTHSTGCASDYMRAKRMAEDMLEKFAMTTYGETAGDILKAADQLSMETVTRYQKNMENIVDMLLKRKELSGEEFVKALGL